MHFVDTHTHLYVEQFSEDQEEVVQRAIDLGVQDFYIPSIDSSYYPDMLALEQKFPKNMNLMIGLHPTHVKEDFQNELHFIKSKLEERSFSAIGEIGIDLYWDKSLLDQQQEAFKEQILLAQNHDLPIAIHCRDAFNEVFEVLEDCKSPKLKGIFHCFTGDKQQAERAIDLNLHLGIGGVLTFKNGKINTFIHELPLERMVLETDAPYLAPTPYRGKRNESSYLVLVAEKMAELYGKSIEEIASVTSKNARNIFETK
jgi:TatD DNase family protein